MEEEKNVILVSAVVVEIDKDTMTTITREVPAHEVEVLRSVFGKDNVREKGPGVSCEVDLEVEFQRLSTKYGETAVADAIGKEGACKRAAQGFQVKAAVAPVVVDKTADEAGEAVPDAMSVADLKTELTARGVEFKGNASKVDLVALVTEARKSEEVQQ